MRDYTAARRAFVEDGKELRTIAAETGISYHTLYRRSRTEDWKQLREQRRNREARERMERLTGLLLDRIERQLDEGETLALKDLKSVTGALRELQELCAPEERAGAEPLTVRFVGETEEMSR